MTTMPHHLDRTIVIHAPRETVFRFFTDSQRWAKWWGAGSTIDAKPGGKVYIRNPGGVEALGEVLELVSPERLVFTYGFASGQPIGPGASRATIRLETVSSGTRLHLHHEFPDAPTRDHHVQGWRYQLAVFSNVVSDEAHADAARLVDGWFDAWAETDVDARTRSLSTLTVPAVSFRDRFSLIDGVSELVPHITAAQHFMPDMRVRRTGDIRHCQGTVLADWIARSADGQERGKGTNVFTFGGDARIESVVGFWG